LIITFPLLSPLNVAAQGFLKVNGKHIENDVNQNFILRGMGFGGWMLQEGYIFDLGFLGQQYIYHKDVVDAMFRQVYSTATLPFKPI